MLFKLSKHDNQLQGLTPVGFHDLSAIGMQEKDLETLIADHLLDTLFEDGTLMPIFQERAGRPKPTFMPWIARATS